MQPYQQYPYYGHSVYPQTPHMGAGPSTGYPAAPPNAYPPNGYPSSAGASNPYTPFYAPNNALHIPPGPIPTNFDAAAYSARPPVRNDPGRPKGHQRNATYPRQKQNTTLPIKPAIKKPSTPYVNSDVPLTRPRTNSMNNRPPEGIMRQRTYSNPNPPDERTKTYHMYVSFHGYNELRLENISQLALREIRDIILPRWEDGVESDIVKDSICIVKFREAPWDMGGLKFLQALRIIVHLFTLCAERGFAFQTSIDTGTLSPRLIFQITRPDYDSRFFLAFFSQAGHQLNLIDPPDHIDVSLGAELKKLLPHQITGEVLNDAIRVIVLRKRNPAAAGDAEPTQFLSHILRVLDDYGFYLDASIPLGRRGTLGMRSRREILVFKGKLPSENS